jgi:MFS family permease
MLAARYVGPLTHLPIQKLIFWFTSSQIFMPIAFAPFANYGAAARILTLFPVGAFITAIFAIFIFYLPEQFPTHLRGTGSGITYNSGRVLTAIFPFVVGYLIEQGANALGVVFYATVLPILALFWTFTGMPIETEDLDLYSTSASPASTPMMSKADSHHVLSDRIVPYL